MSATLDHTLSLGDSAALAAGGVEREDPFVLARFGDGDLYSMKADSDADLAEMLQATLGDRPGRPPLALSCGELITADLRTVLREAWTAITTGDHTLMLGDPTTSDFGRELWPYWHQIAGQIERPYIPVHHETFWLRGEPQPELVRFCRAVKGSRLRKLLVARPEAAPAARMLHADFHPVPATEALTEARAVIRRGRGYDIVLIAAGRAGKTVIAGLLDPKRTLIDIGALFDPLYIGNTRPRAGVASDADAEAFFSEVAGEHVSVSPERPGRPYGASA